MYNHSFQLLLYYIVLQLSILLYYYFQFCVILFVDFELCKILCYNIVILIGCTIKKWTHVIYNCNFVALSTYRKEYTMWFFIFLLILAVIFNFGDITFNLAIYGIVLFFANWLINKLLNPEEQSERGRNIILIGKIIFFLLITILFIL